MYRLTHIKLHNICQHDDFECDVQAGLNAVLGPNGCGKTSLLRGVAYALTGLVDGLWGSQQDLQKDAAPDIGYAEASFIGNGHEYTIRRFSTKSVKLTDRLWEDGKLIAERRRQVDAFMEQVFGMSCQLMFTVCWGRQGELAQLLKSPPAIISTFLAQLFDTRQLDKLRDRLKDAIESIAPIPDCADQLNADRDALDKLPSAEALETNLKACQAIKETADNRLAELKTQMSSAVLGSELDAQIAECKDALHKLIPAVSNKPEGNMTAEQCYDPDDVRKLRVDALHKRETAEIMRKNAETRLSDANITVDAHRRFLTELAAQDNERRTRLKSADKTTCPLCGSHVESNTEIESRINKMILGFDRIEDYEASIDRSRLRTQTELDRQLKEVSANEAAIDAANAEIEEQNRIIRNLDILFEWSQYWAARIESDELTKHLKRLQETPRRSDEFCQNIAKATADASKASADVLSAAADQARINATREMLTASIANEEKTVEKFRVASVVRNALMSIREAMAQPRAQARYLKHRIELLNSWIAKYLVYTGMPFTVRLDTEERMFMFTTQDGHDHPAVHLSGAQQAMTAVALQMALFAVMNPSMNLYMIDEPTEPCDNGNKETMAAMFARMNSMLPSVDGTMLIVTRDEITIQNCSNVIEIGEQQ